MAKKRPDGDLDLMMGGAGVLAAFWTALRYEVEKLGGTAKDLHRLVTPEGTEIIKGMAALIVSAKQATSNMITVLVPSVNRDFIDGKEMLGEFGTVVYNEEEIVKSIPPCGLGISANVLVAFFKSESLNPSTIMVAHEYEIQRVIPDLYAVIRALKNDPKLMNECTIVVQWEDANGKKCFAHIYRSASESRVFVDRCDDGTRYGNVWFGGVRKLLES